MKQKFKGQFSVSALALLVTLVFSSFTVANLQAQEKISGVVKDVGGIPLPGVSILQKGTTRGASTDFDGNYTLELTSGQKTLVFSYLGFKTVEIQVNNRTTIDVTMEEDIASLDEVVVIGYGTQKKESVVGAITQIKGESLQELNSGITNVEEALQGNLPGVTAIQGSGVPGRNDMQIFIRGQASWNGSGQPLILVDGAPRDIDNIDFNDIENLSVLKDASATAVFGVQGANGVILITTKRGQKGKAQLSLQANTTLKFVSKLPEKLGVFDAIMEANSSILRELPYREESWDNYRPIAIADRFQNPANEAESLIYPNVDWKDVLLKDFAQDYRVNLSVRGGGNNARYFGSLAYQTVSDIFDGDSYDNGKGYDSGFGYERFNFRSNIDFDITKTTEFSVNLGGFYGIQKTPGNLNLVTNSIYELAPNAYTPLFPDGAYGRDDRDIFANTNPLVVLTNTGYTSTNTFNINTDFILKQRLDFITKGLSFQGRFSLDNRSTSRQRLFDNGGDGQENVRYRVYNEDFEERIESPNGVNDFGFVPFPWTIEPTQILDGNEGSAAQRMRRNLLYDFSFNYNRTFADKHAVTGLVLVRRRESGTGNGFLRYREDWVGRVTYDYDKRYFLDISGAYNGSEKYGPGFRFEVFPAAAAGWTVTNESFMENVDWLNLLKFRGSYGLIGDDSGGGRFEYQKTWSIGGGAFINPNGSNGRSPYVFYSEDNVGNPNLQWETAVKYNIGVELGLFNNAIKAEVDVFGEDRSDILIPSSQRAVPEWFGASPPAFNRGEVEVRGFEVVLSANHTFASGVNIFGNVNFTQAKDLVLDREDPELRPFYQKAAGYTIGQPRLAIPAEIMGSLDDLYSSTPRVNGNELIRTGYYNLVDYDGDGTYNGAFDNVPYGYPVRPQRTWAATVGAKYKGWRLSVQFYGTQNTNRNYSSRTFSNQIDTFFEHELGYWTKDNPTGVRTQPTFAIDSGASDLNTGGADPRSNFFDGSLTRLRSIALNYSIPKKTCERLGVKALSVFANGNNLFLWTDLPDDREFNSSQTQDSTFRGDYPTMARFNVGFNLDF
ncbi:SusC/RagA family TonB-linked outer membrane protein [Seonamhaeicola aphaedonensis]|uniref:TonB-linked SusC/RagA family outer membrane protein n=1 Tax=Seonamhaeicola aphaedonensis TaxID=1461338 RepID=A0A3D9H8C4_9FLAO|nr:TonB-dependent receptor [Seonamhaeicola aphaedonensis]RED45752.1 TonB-linked SusC/RagA family outer membrane protein [Seonamhaeicola aphaedonensis]